MKIEIQSEKKAEEIKYPCLMIETKYRTIVLMTERGKGCAISPGADSTNSIGEYHPNCMGDIWDMDVFEPFKGKITLEND